MLYGGLVCLGMLTILCLYYIYYSCTYMACDTWCACHAYWAFYFLKCLSYALLYLYLFTGLVYLPCLWGLLYLVMLILCLTIFAIAVLILLATLGVLAILIWGFYFLKCLFYALLYLYLFTSLEYLPCYMGLLSLGMLILCFTIFTMACTYISLGELVILMGAFISWHAYLMPYYIYYNMYLPSLEYF